MLAQERETLIFHDCFPVDYSSKTKSSKENEINKKNDFIEKAYIFGEHINITNYKIQEEV